MNVLPAENQRGERQDEHAKHHQEQTALQNIRSSATRHTLRGYDGVHRVTNEPEPHLQHPVNATYAKQQVLSRAARNKPFIHP